MLLQRYDNLSDADAVEAAENDRRSQLVLGTWKTVTLIGAIRLGQKPRLMSHRGTADARLFRRFTKLYLVPYLRPGDVVVMDNLNFHKSKAVRDPIEAARATPIYLPANRALVGRHEAGIANARDPRGGRPAACRPPTALFTAALIDPRLVSQA